MTIRDAYKEGREELKLAGIPDAELDAWYLLEYVTGISRAAYYADPDRELAKKDREKYWACLEKRKKRIPLQHITGEQEFMGLLFSVNKHVLIPRQDTEILVEEALKLADKDMIPCENGKMRILDMCTGSGCILLSMLYYIGKPANGRSLTQGESPAGKAGETALDPIAAEGIGADISEKALLTARRNADDLGIKAEFVQGDLFENVSGRFALILSNPPYIRTEEIGLLQEEVRLHDPREALDGKEDGLYFYRRIIKEAKDYLLPGGYLVFEIGYDQAEAVRNLMSEARYTDITVKKELAGLDRIVCGRYIK